MKEIRRLNNMAKSKIIKKFGAGITGVLNIEDGIITVQVEDVTDPVVLSEFIKEFSEKEIKISVTYGQEI